MQDFSQSKKDYRKEQGGCDSKRYRQHHQRLDYKGNVQTIIKALWKNYARQAELFCKPNRYFYKSFQTTGQRNSRPFFG